MPIIIEYSDELTHYGRLGMKWGQHIFGKDDSGSGNTKKKRKTLKERFIEKRQKRRARKKAEQENLELERRKAILADPNLLTKHKSEFTTEEINQAIERFRAEKNLRAIANETHSERIKELRKGYDYTKTVVDYTAASMNAYNNFAKIYNTFSKAEKEFPIIGAKPAPKSDAEAKKPDEEKKKP